jgi:hypothetical protein
LNQWYILLSSEKKKEKKTREREKEEAHTFFLVYLKRTVDVGYFIPRINNRCILYLHNFLSYTSYIQPYWYPT